MKPFRPSVFYPRSLRPGLITAALAMNMALSASGSFAQEPAEGAAAPGDTGTWTLNFRDSDIGEVIRFVAEATGKTLIVDPTVSGSVQVISTEPVDSAELYELFLSILDVNGFAAIESGSVVRIVPAQAATALAVPLSLDAAPAGAGLVTQVIQLDSVSAEQLVPVLRTLASPESQMTAYANSNSIIVTDSAANVERIRNMVAFIDESAVAETEVVVLENASAPAVVDLLLELRGDAAVPDATAPDLAADARTNSILIKGTQVQIQRLLPLIAQLDSPLTQDGKVNVIYLQYAQAEELAPLLSGLAASAAAPAASDAEGAAPASSFATPVTVQADAATNSLIVTADAEQLQMLRNVIARLDIRRAQVLVEAIIVELSGERGQDLGVQWLFLDDNGAYGSSSTGSPTSAAIAGAALSSDNVDIRAPLARALAGTPGQLLGVGRLDDDVSFNVLINALQADDSANILSTPSLLTLDNEEATITVGRNVPFVTGSFTSTGNGASNPDNPFQTVERQNVGVTLRVKPQVNEGDSLVLELSQEVSSLLGAGSVLLNDNPITNERIIETTVLADNGQTVVLGGLIEDSVNETNQRVPLLGDIPGLGRLFRNDSTTLGKTHLVVFLRATIMREARTLEAATGDKYRVIREEQARDAAAGAALVPGEDFPLLPEWEALLQQLQQTRATSAPAAAAANAPPAE